jgi:hypothetical protein
MAPDSAPLEPVAPEVPRAPVSRSLPRWRIVLVMLVVAVAYALGATGFRVSALLPVGVFGPLTPSIRAVDYCVGRAPRSRGPARRSGEADRQRSHSLSGRPARHRCRSLCCRCRRRAAVLATARAAFFSAAAVSAANGSPPARRASVLGAGRPPLGLRDGAPSASGIWVQAQGQGAPSLSARASPSPALTRVP